MKKMIIILAVILSANIAWACDPKKDLMITAKEMRQMMECLPDNMPLYLTKNEANEYIQDWIHGYSWEWTERDQRNIVDEIFRKARKGELK